jgi:hypothetical protein
MKKHVYIRCHILFLIFLITKEAFTQEVFSIEKQIQMAMAEHGFENVAVCKDTNRVIIGYENRVYRHEVRAIREALEVVSKFNNQQTIILVPQDRGVPLLAVSVNWDVYRNRLNKKKENDSSNSGIEVSLDVEPYWQRLKDQSIVNPSTMKFDIVVYPQYRALFGNFNNPVASQINLAPALSTSLWNGMQFSAQWIIPLQNELEEEGNYGRPGLLTFNQTIRIPNNTFVSATVGYFTQHQYGVDVEAKRFLDNGRWAIGANIGYTGYASYLHSTLYYSNLQYWSYFLNCEYRYSDLDVTMKATYGRFLYEDRGVRFDVLRQFGEIDIGFFCIATKNGTDGGFNFSVPIFPGKRLSPGLVRISPAPYFPWEYRYRGDSMESVRYTTANSIDAFIEKLNPDYVKNQLSK